MTSKELLQWLEWLLRKLAWLVLLGSLAWIFVKILPLLAALLVALLALLKIKIAVATAAFLIVLVLVLLWFLLMWLDSGTPVTTAGCTLTTHWLKPDKCTTKSCPVPCVAITGPYPRWGGSLTWWSQDIACLCFAGKPVLAALAPWLQKALDGAISIREIAQATRKIEELIAGDVDPETLRELLRVFEKLKRGEELTEEEKRRLRELLGG